MSIKQLLDKENLSQRKFSELTGIEVTQVSKIVNGKMVLSPINCERVKKVFKYFDCEDEVTIMSDNDYMEVAVIPISAQAGYLDSIINQNDEYFMKDMTTVLVPKVANDKGNYVIMEVNGTSMDDGTFRSIRQGDKLFCKELQRHHWVNKLHFRQYLFVIVSAEGIVFKQITDHNVHTGDIRCHSFNEEYSDYTINLNDVYKLFYVKEYTRKVVP